MIKDARLARAWLKKFGSIVRSDKEIAADLGLFLTEAEERLKIAAAHPAATPALKEAFNNVAGVLPAGHKFARKGKLSLPAKIGIAAKHRKLEKSFGTLSGAFNAGNPAVVRLVAFVMTSHALRRVFAKTNGVLYSLQDKPDGSGSVNMLLPVPGGFPDHIPLKPLEYTGLKVMLRLAAKPPRRPGI